MSPRKSYEAFQSPAKKPLGFEIDPVDKKWSFVPEFYPEDFTDMKNRDLERHGSGCEAESVSIKAVKNKEIHVSGKILRGELPLFRSLQDLNEPADVISPLFEDGGLECYVKRAERGNEQGWDPHRRQRIFSYDMDLVSTGKDERDSQFNAIVSDII